MSDSSEGRESVLGLPLGAMASAGVLGGPGVRIVSLVEFEAREAVDSTCPEDIVLEVGRTRERDSRLGLARFMVKTEGRVDGDVDMVAIEGSLDVLSDEEDGEAFMVTAENSWLAPSSESTRFMDGRPVSKGGGAVVTVSDGDSDDVRIIDNDRVGALLVKGARERAGKGD